MKTLKNIVTGLFMTIVIGSSLNAVMREHNSYGYCHRYDDSSAGRSERIARQRDNLIESYRSRITELGETPATALNKIQMYTSPSLREEVDKYTLFKEIIRTEQSAIDAVNAKLEVFREDFYSMLENDVQQNTALYIIKKNIKKNLPSFSRLGDYFIEKRAFELLLEEWEVEQVYGPGDDADLAEDFSVEYYESDFSETSDNGK